jgi:hypothetical protein
MHAAERANDVNVEIIGGVDIHADAHVAATLDVGCQA